MGINRNGYTATRLDDRVAKVERNDGKDRKFYLFSFEIDLETLDALIDWHINGGDK